MRCEPFADLLLRLLENSGNEQIKAVRTFTESGFHKQVGVEVTTLDGFTTYIQIVRTSAPGGDRDNWADSNEHKATSAPRTFKPLQADVKAGVKSAAPKLKIRDMEAAIKALLVAADHPDFGDVQTYEEAELATSKPHGIKVTCADGSNLFAMFYGVTPPGATKPSHPEYQMPKEYL